ncbi:MAG: type II toxin-antitoxin system VapC family toxin [Pseudomonadota bacterium]
MIVLDTNVLSELMKAEPAEQVATWVGKQPATSLFVTAINEAEVLYGVRLMPEGPRRSGFEAATKAMFEEDFASRVLAFGRDAADAYADISVARRRLGRPISQFDAQIAAIARSAGAVLATRNVANFEGCNLKLVDPWGC